MMLFGFVSSVVGFESSDTTCSAAGEACPSCCCRHVTAELGLPWALPPRQLDTGASWMQSDVEEEAAETARKVSRPARNFLNKRPQLKQQAVRSALAVTRPVACRPIAGVGSHTSVRAQSRLRSET